MFRGKILGKGRFNYQVGWWWSAELLLLGPS